MEDVAERPAVKERPFLQPVRLQVAEYERRQWIANLEHGRTIEQILDPGYWSLVAMKFQPLDQIEVRTEDGSWIAFLIVSACDRTWARVVVDRIVQLTEGDRTRVEIDRHVVEWKGPQNKYTVIRVADQKAIKNGFQTKDEAAVWAREHEKLVR